MKPPLRYIGAKWKLARWIVSHIPEHVAYLEPYFGSGAVFFNKPPSKLETINDIDQNVVNLWKIIRDRTDEFIKAVEFTPCARDEYYASFEKTDDDFENARRFLTRCWQAHGGSINSRAGWRNNTNGAANYSAVWLQLGERILPIAHRLKCAQIENQPALQLIERYKHSDVLIYADPPYPLSTRNRTFYAHEMTDTDHLDLLNALDQHPGHVLLSGYACDLYDNRLQHWQRETHGAVNVKGGKREEVLWIKQKKGN